MFQNAAYILFLSALIPRTSAQTHTDCNPLIAKCHADPALGSSFNWNFATQGESDSFSVLGYNDKITYDNDGAHFTISGSGDAPTISSNFYIMFGQVDIVAKSAPGIGIVSAAVLISDDLDEIDWEWLGKDNSQVQTNYFSKGDDTTFDRGGFSHVSTAQNEYHTYGIEWTASRVVWTIDGQIVRVLDNPGNGYYPQTPMQVRIGSWSAGDPKNRIGTIQWAGGETNYTQGPFVFTIKSVNIHDYSTGKEYVYGDHSGSWTSIQSVNGNVNSNADDTQGTVQKLFDSNQGKIMNKDQDIDTPKEHKVNILSISTSTQLIPASTSTSILTFTTTATLQHNENNQYDVSTMHNDSSYNPKLYGRFKEELFARSNSTLEQKSGVERDVKTSIKTFGFIISCLVIVFAF